jgi:hypothetical protein
MEVFMAKFLSTSFLSILMIGQFTIVLTGESENWQVKHPEWIFCDDFEDTTALVKPSRYFEYNNNRGDFANVKGAGIDGSYGMRTIWQSGEVDAGSIKLAFGKHPVSYMNKQGIRPNDTFREIYYRMYIKMQDGWQGSPAKLSRASVFSNTNNWGQAMIAHLWSDDLEHLILDPASCVSNGVVNCTTYNDFANLKWIGQKSGTTPIFATVNSGKWYCVEHHIKLNDPGQSNGIQEFWINDTLEARRENLNFVGTFNAYAINAVFFENYWNNGSPKLQERYFDNIVISTSKIGMIQKSTEIKKQNNKPIQHNNHKLEIKKNKIFYDIRGRKIDRSAPFEGLIIDSERNMIRLNVLNR